MKIVCVGRNYKEHILELNNDLPEAPVVFFKPESSLIQSSQISIPAFTDNLHYECELVLKVNKDVSIGTHITHIQEICDEWTIGIDFTARDIQDDLKSKKLPWELAKSFDNAALIGQWLPIAQDNMYDTRFVLWINGHIVQDGHLQDLIFNFEAIVNYCLQYFSFQKGDVIFTGTPKGVNKVNSGDVLKGVFLTQEVFSLEII